MYKKLLPAIILLMGWALTLKAQGFPVTTTDGPAVKTDSLEIRPRPSRPGMLPLFPMQRAFLRQALSVPEYETKEQWAARQNAAAFNSVMSSVDKTLYWYRQPKYSEAQKWIFWGLGLFLSNPFGFPQGYVPMANASFPFIYAREPGMAPYTSPYSPDFFPATVKTEYDFATGTYKQVMIDWADYQKLLDQRFPATINVEPIPKVQVTPVERMMNQSW